MKVKVTATITLETEIWPEDYDGVEDVKKALHANDYDKAAEAAIAFELKQMGSDPWESALAEHLCGDGELSDITITKLEAPAKEEAA